MRHRPERPVVAFAFPGVGAEWSGAEAGFLRRHGSAMRPCLDAASDAAGADLAAAVASGRHAQLGREEQELLAYALSCAAHTVCRDAGVHPALVAGYSLGVYTAMACSGAVSFAEGLGMVRRAHALARAACAGGRFGMGAVVGLSVADVTALLARPERRGLCLANVNSDYAVTLSGTRGALDPFLEDAAAHGALKVVALDVDIPYHNPNLLAGVSETFAAELRTAAWREPLCPIVSSVDQALLAAPDRLREFTAKNLSTPFHWQRTVERLARAGVDLVIECGPGVALTQNARFIAGAPEHANLKNAPRRLGL
jgi:[acyl-carrier-protein] S-malonyltransferase